MFKSLLIALVVVFVFFGSAGVAHVVDKTTMFGKQVVHQAQEVAKQ